MNTIRVNICYRPLRIAWAIRDGDMEAFRRAVRLSHMLWGGRFNCIVIVDHEEEATRLVELFRADIIMPLGDSKEVRAFVSKFEHIISPFFHDGPFIGSALGATNCQILDVHNLLATIHGTPDQNTLIESGVRMYSWSVGDPLADLFLMMLGEYPPVSETLTDYASFLTEACSARQEVLNAGVIPADILKHPTVAHISGHGITQHYSVPRGWDAPGFYVGDLTNMVDLVSFWNLRAMDITLLFVDPRYLERYAGLVPAWDTRVRDVGSHRHEFGHRVAVWSRMDLHEARKPFSGEHLVACPVSAALWDGRNVRPPMMQLGEASTLGVIGNDRGRPSVSFTLTGRPFCGDHWFHRQHLVASVSLLGGLLGDEQHTLSPPFVPELHEFYARTMQFGRANLRSESERVGLIIDAADSDTFLRALPVADLMERIFAMGQLTAKRNAAGHIARQVIASCGGLQGARVLKIPGVRRLMRTHGPTGTFTKNAALQLIGGADPGNREAKFSNHHSLYIERRDPGANLTPQDVFTYLAERGLIRVGFTLTCPACQLSTWIPLDTLKQQAKCDLCGHEWNATRQLVNEDWHYRRSGALGVEKHSLGAVPVVLTLQQLDANLHGVMNQGVYSASLDLVSDGDDQSACEVDFIWIIPRALPRKTVVMLGECKDQGGKIDRVTIDNLRRCADSLPRNRFETFVVLSKLCPFTPEEVELARTLNDDQGQRVIMLTVSELEPYNIYERAEPKSDYHAGTPEDLAQGTAQLYFAKREERTK